MSDTTEIPFKIRSIQLVDFCIHADVEKPIIIPEDNFGKKFSFLVGIEMRADSGRNAVAVRPTITVSGYEDNIDYASITTQLVFEFEGLSRYFPKGEMKIPQKYIDRMNSIGISTTRGVLWKELESTPLKGAVIPIVDVSLFEIEEISTVKK